MNFKIKTSEAFSGGEREAIASKMASISALASMVTYFNLDYPRSNPGLISKYHVDMQCWVIFFLESVIDLA